MKKVTLLIFSLVWLSSYAQQWQWMLSLPDTGGLRSGIIQNQKGDILARQTTWSNMGGHCYSSLTNVSNQGMLNWSKHYENLYITDFITDSNFNIYLTGNFSDTLSIDSSQIISQGSQDGILLKLDKDGQLLNYSTFSSDTTEACNGIYFQAGKIYVTGSSTKLINIQGQQLIITLQQIYSLQYLIQV